MYYPSLPVVSRLLQQKKIIIPLRKEIEAAFRPQEVYKKIYAEAGHGLPSFLLESCRTHPKTGRFSFIGGEPFLIFKAKGRSAEITRNGRTEAFSGDPMKILRSLLNKYRSLKTAGVSGFTGGAVGYFAYDCCHLFERLPKKAKDDLCLPDMFFMFTDTGVAFDHVENKTAIFSNIYPDKPLNKAYDEAVEKIERLHNRLSASPAESANHSPLTAHHSSNYRSTFTKEGFKDIIRRAKEYIAAGDIYQVNLSQRFCADTNGVDPFVLYQRLSSINPSPFACYLALGDLKIVSSSPERLLKLDGNLVQTRPIAGTRPRGKTAIEDLELSCELILSDKERAEHIMLVDLERNDLGRVCEYGTVRVDELMSLEDYSHVIHIVSNVIGRLKPDKDRFDLIAAAFPGGTITGCPKIRCMEIIDELEPVSRNIYTGSIGYLGFNGDMDLNIAIRTFVIKDNKAYAQVGAGMVADSEPEREYHETLHKAEALFKALESSAASQPQTAACAGLDNEHKRF